jgi:hypothetical protein
MTFGDANFFLAFAEKNGRKPVASRNSLLTFMLHWEIGNKGPLGKILRKPIWLSRRPLKWLIGPMWHRCPWKEIDEFLEYDAEAPPKKVKILDPQALTVWD